MEKSTIEILFEWLNNTTEVIQKHENETYLDSLTTTLETLFYQDTSENIDDMLSRKLQIAIEDMDLSKYSTEEIRKAIQLTILKGMQGSTQQQHTMTPESVALFISYLAGKLTKGAENIRVFDPACGTANLLTTVVGQLKKPGEAFASEIDPTLIKLALLSANLQKMSIEFFHQDSLTPFLLDPVDLIVADLPVGYYPDDIRANDYELKADKGHSYAHHLFIEQSMNYTKESGYALLLIPDFLFDSDQSDALHTYIQKHAHIVGVLRLAESSFASKKNVKSILILQKKGKDTIGPQQPLLVNLPSFKNTNAMEDILEQINGWFVAYESES